MTPTKTTSLRPSRIAGFVGAAALALATAALGQELEGDALAAALERGGYVIVMRHASSPRAKPAADEAAPGNVERERQLDRQGQDSAAAMGAAMKRLGIPIGEVLSSPTFRALQTARALDLGTARAVDELGDGGADMRPDAEGRRSAWLRREAAEPPPPGTNRLMITHVPNLVGAFGDDAAGMGDGESLVVRPGAGRAAVVAHVKIDDWPRLAR